MRKLFYLLAVVCLIGWGVSVFAYAATGLIHSLLAFVVIFFTLATMKDENDATQPAQ